MKRKLLKQHQVSKKPKIEAVPLNNTILNDADTALIRERYLGNGKIQNRQLSRKVEFGWDPKDDTTIDDPMYDLMVHATSKRDTLEIKSDYKLKTKLEMSDRDYKLFRDEHQISLKYSSIAPLRHWNDSLLNKHLLELLKNLDFNHPTPIQMQAIPVALTHKDIIGLSKTGSGKTLAFLLPTLHNILELPAFNDETKFDGPYALVITPTRELAQQIEKYAVQFCQSLGLTCLSLIGGKNMQHQSFQFRNGAHLVIATPGRLIDCLEQGVISLNQCCTLILDECDKMVDYGFQRDVKRIINYCKCPLFAPSSKTQILMFSATLVPELEAIAQQYLVDPAIIKIGSINKAIESVKQSFEQVSSESEKKQKLLSILKAQRPPIIIFVNMKGQADALAKMIKKINIPCVSLHGGKTQQQREMAMSKFKEKRVDVLITTDVSSRGLDIDDIQLVINYDMAKDLTSYTHRIGRTGRNGKTGKSVTFIYKDDDPSVLKQYLKESGTPLPRFME